MKTRIIKGTESFFIKNKDLTYKEQINLYNKKYKILLTKSEIAHIRQKLNVVIPTKEKYFLNDEQKEYLKGILHKPSKEISKLFYDKYGYKFTKRQIVYYRKLYNIKGEHIGRFKKGNIPYNKNKDGEITFRKSTGYYYIKKDNKGIRLGRYMWEKYNNKKIPEGYVVMFLDKNTRNISRDNLVLIKNRDLLVAKNCHLIYNNKNLTKTGLMIAKLINKSKDVRDNL